jgi:hypothetical protein
MNITFGVYYCRVYGDLRAKEEPMGRNETWRVVRDDSQDSSDRAGAVRVGMIYYLIV